jgi:hypothetical protein
MKLANNLPADAADCEKAVHGGGYAVEGAFRQAFAQCTLPQSGRDIAPDRQDAGEFQPG